MSRTSRASTTIHQPVVHLVVAWNCRTASYITDVGLEAVEINEAVDAHSSESVHAARVVASLVDMVDSDCVCSKLLHESCVSLALFGIDKRIVFDKLVGNT